MRPNGFTLIELMVTVSVIAILAVVAAPSFNQMYDRYRLKGVVDVLYGDLQFARAEAVRRNDNVFFSFTTGANWCYGLNPTSTCNCATVGSCTIKTVSSSAFPGVTLNSAAFGAGTSTSFNARLGAASVGGTAIFQSAAGNEARVVVSLVGRVRRCSPAGAGYISYYPSC